MSTNVGTIRLRNLAELQTSNFDEVAATTKSISEETNTPEKHKKARKVRAATTTKKKTKDEITNAQAIVSSTAVKRNGKKEPLPGQLRIDAFFKSSTKSYKVEPFPTISPGKAKLRRSPRKGCKRLFDEKSTTTESMSKMSDISSEIQLSRKPTRKRTQPQRNAKAKCTTSPGDVIDLCSDDEPESDNKPAVLSVLAAVQPEAPAMVNIPCLNIQRNLETEASSKENMPKTRQRKRCPPYKIVEDTTFVVDGFQFGDIPNATHYFLSHYHADHYIGLTRKFAHPLYMSPITASLVRTFIPIDSQYLHEIAVDQSITLNDIEVTAIDANHCPGAIMLIFKFNTGKCILHTGDFRASFEMESLPIFWNLPNIDVLYLDTTYLSQNYDFCHQSDSIYRVCSLVRQFHEKNASKRILHVCGSYLIGKEKVWSALVEEFRLRVWTEPNRRKAIECLDWPELKLSLCDDPFEANLHVINLGKISYPQLDQYFKQFEGHYDMLLGIRPSGWEKNSKPSYGKRISVIGVEYSEHSSYKELERFVRFLKPKNVISTVPLGRDLCVTPTVPTNWFRYKGYGGMLSKSYQPSISTFLETPQRKPPTMANRSTNMILSPIENCGITNSESLDALVREESAKDDSTDAAHQSVDRFMSDASNDLLSII
ncbi:DNA cross-link repair 1A protein [Drosophila montana]|uniref:DNA cross-link repair 1A protein n=1 Tax=Drosophila montana TaxID=40370 RepID=UPI00313F3CF5